MCGIAGRTYGLTTTLPLVCAVGAWVPVSQLAEHEVAAYSKLEEERATKALDVLIDICASQRVRSFLRPHQLLLPSFLLMMRRSSF